MRLLTDVGLEPTSKRLYVLELLLRATKALSAPQLLEHIVHDNAMNKVTLYRILDKLVEKGVVRRTTSADRMHRYCAGFHGEFHCHFHCVRCDKTYCLPPPPDNRPTMPPEMCVGRIDTVDILYEGVCSACIAPCETDSPPQSP
ncbi:Fur family transcriptional regulator [Desulfovibrio inopinatus]|uniref:Fur family transcriptional regulator n=1 Tax=Desulfovibrio inopinatus TaxID=102109 RepID=UPI00146FC51F|nr:transcriptional repressor [Desulfovibrio inopinatus]